MNVYVRAVFTKNSGEPATGLFPLPTITIINLVTGIVLVNNDSMQEVGQGAYRYLFTSFNQDNDYHVVCTCSDSELDIQYVYGGNDLFTDEFIGAIADETTIRVGENFKGFPS